jgi:hypothetical protein
VVIPTLQSASIETPDAALAPAHASATVGARIYDATGQVIYTQVFTGSVTKRVPSPGPGPIEFVTDSTMKAIGEVIASAAEEAVEAMANDAAFAAALR